MHVGTVVYIHEPTWPAVPGPEMLEGSTVWKILDAGDTRIVVFRPKIEGE